MASGPQILEDARLRLKILRNVAREALVAVARAEEFLLEETQPRQEAQSDENRERQRV